MLHIAELNVVTAFGIEFEKPGLNSFNRLRERAGGDYDTFGVDGFAIIESNLHGSFAMDDFERALAQQLPMVTLETLRVSLAQR